jgi:hypothetical protein
MRVLVIVASLLANPKEVLIDHARKTQTSVPITAVLCKDSPNLLDTTRNCVRYPEQRNSLLARNFLPILPRDVRAPLYRV